MRFLTRLEQVDELTRSDAQMTRSRGLLLLMFCTLLIGCQKQPGGEQADESLPKIRLALNWFPEPEHGGYYAALLAGDFEAEGLNVEIIPGGPDSPVIPRLVRGQVEFGIDSADKVLIQRAQDAEVVTLFAPLQTSPRCLLTHQSSGIDDFNKLRDITLAVGVGQSFVKYLQVKLPLENVQLIPYSGRMGLFLEDERQAIQGFSFSEPVFARRRGVEVNVLMLADLGFNPYSSCVIVDQSYLDSHPEIVQKFTRACRKGWERYLSDPQAVHEAIAKLNPELELDALVDAHAALKPLCAPPEGEALGSMQMERWETLRDQLIELEYLKADTVSDLNSVFRNP